MKPTDILGNIKLYNADNMEVMKTFKDKQFDLAIVDQKTYKYDTRFKTVTNWQSRRISCLR